MAQVSFDQLLNILVQDFNLPKESAESFLTGIWGDSGKALDLESLRARTASAFQDFILEGENE